MKKKVLLMGKSGSGKTSMRSIIFANYIARDTMKLGATIDVEHSHVKFLGNLALNLWDCGGQDHFMDTYLESQRDHIFQNVEVLIHVFDVESNGPTPKDLKYFRNCLEAISQNSLGAKVFCLIHKMDLIPEAKREKVFKEKESMLKQIARSLNVEITCFKTSIWDETLFKAWSTIVYSLVPNIKTIEANLDNFTKICGADEVVLFERATFLVISHSSNRKQEHPDIHRFEKISNIIKQFKLSCSKAQFSQFKSMQVKNKFFNAFLEDFTQNTYILVIVSDQTIQPQTTLFNIKIAKNHFEKFLTNLK